MSIKYWSLPSKTLRKYLFWLATLYRDQHLKAPIFFFFDDFSQWHKINQGEILKYCCPHVFEPLYNLLLIFLLSIGIIFFSELLRPISSQLLHLLLVLNLYKMLVQTTGSGISTSTKRRNLPLWVQTRRSLLGGILDYKVWFGKNPSLEAQKSIVIKIIYVLYL